MAYDKDDKDTIAAIASAVASATSALVETNKQIKAEKTTLKTQFDDLSLTVDKLNTTQQSANEAASIKAGEWESVLADRQTRHETQIAEKDKEILAFKEASDSAIIDSAVTKAISDAGGNHQLLAPHVKNVRVFGEGSSAYIAVVDSTDKIKLNASGQPMSVFDLVESMKTDALFAVAFKATTGSGTGATAAGNILTSNPFKIGKENFTEMSKIMRDNPDAANALRAEAGLPPLE